MTAPTTVVAPYTSVLPVTTSTEYKLAAGWGPITNVAGIRINLELELGPSWRPVQCGGLVDERTDGTPDSGNDGLVERDQELAHANTRITELEDQVRMNA